MTYSMEWLLAKVDRQEPVKYLFFWGHQPSKDGRISPSCFSQWWEAPFQVEGVDYKTAEHWMMAQKAILFDDTETLHSILKAKSPAEAKKLGRKVRNFDEAKWVANRYEAVIEGNYQKFNQHPDLKAFLLSTSNRILVEASPSDSIWGIGLIASDERVHQPVNWQGMNLLGFALMEVRDRLQL